MVKERIRKYQKTSFSHSVVMAILIAGGVSWQLKNSCVFADEIIDKTPLPTIELTEGASGLGLDYVSLSKLQHVTNETTIYSIDAPLSWSDLVVLPNEPFMAHSFEDFIDYSRSQGLVFLYERKNSLSSSQGLPYQGLIFSGSESSSKMNFENIKSFRSGSTIYSEADVVFKSLAEGSSFCRCESFGSGGAIFALKDIVFQNNSGSLVFLENKSLVNSDIDLTPMEGGGAILSFGSISFIGNQNIQCCDNTAQASGGAILGESMLLSETTGDILFKNNSANKYGGAIRTKQNVCIKNNLGVLQFEENKADCAGGAIFCGSYLTNLALPDCIEISNNVGSVYFTKNISASAVKTMARERNYTGGGALWGTNVLISENLGDISFSENQGGNITAIGTYVGGGAIFSLDVAKISENSGTINFIRNIGQALANVPLPASSTEDGVKTLDSSQNQKEIDSKLQTASLDSALQRNASTEDKILSPDQVLEDIRGGGAIFAKKIEITNNTGHLGFGYNSGGGAELSLPNDRAVVGGGALLGIFEVSLQENNSVSFSDNITSGVKDCGGAILSRSIKLEGNSKLAFTSNGSSFLGGAICALEGTVDLKNNMGPVSFIDNRTRFGGGAISSSKASVTITGNQGFLEFKNNIAYGHPVSEFLEEGQTDLSGRYSGGGAILAENFVEITNNSGDLLFSGNQAGAFGGAILVGSLESTSGNAFGEKVEDSNAVVSIVGNSGNIIFSGNSTTVAISEKDKRYGGGAIHTKELNVSENGLVAFYNNRAATGAAVRISEGGSMSLQASKGDIIFQGNINFNGDSEAIYLAGTRSKIRELSAASGRSIVFKDGITFENLVIRKGSDGNPLNDPLFFNSKEKDHQGTILFSQAISKIPQTAILQGGTLALTGNAELCLGGLKQELGSEILLEAGTTLRIYDKFLSKEETKSLIIPKEEASRFPKSSEDFASSVALEPLAFLDLNNLSIDISSFSESLEKDELLPPQVVVPVDSVEGLQDVRLKIVDSTGLGYENHSLLSSPKNISLIAFSTSLKDVVSPVTEASLSNIKVDIALPEMSAETYGHAGVWSEARVEEGKLVIDWEPTGYNLNPEKQGSLVLNTLWGVGEDLRAIKLQQQFHNMTTQRMELDFSTNIWGAGFGTFANCSSETKIDGFTHRVGGYIVGMDTQLIEDFLIGGSFSQCLGYTSSTSYDARSDTSSYIGSGYLSILSGSWLFKGSFVYGQVANDLKTRYAGLGSSSANWNSQGFLADVRVDYRYIVNPRKFISAIVSTFVPFAEVEYIRIDLPEVKEIGNEARIFQQGRLENIAIPVGLTLEQNYSRGSHSEVNGLSVTYIFDVYRQQPESVISLPEAVFSWKGMGADVSPKAIRAQFNNDTEWSSYFSTHFGVNYEWREHINTLDINAGIRVIF
ncbi:autotransporter domain-containing protein [Chlamydia sp. 17-3921]|uniref:autotransporter domain-containing protein n=1 Tax=Chlamydia sp. 17-3921 TaxID=2675798 RepID=UPI001919F3B8|nr:autotransporter domain-containing protein [Chlamydia sp. 17-3921]